MFNEKKTGFLSIISILFVLIFISACKKTEVYDLNTNNNEKVVEEKLISTEEGIIEDNKQDEPQVIEKLVEEKETIIFEDLSWKKYSNKSLGYSIDYPTIVNILGDDLDQHVEFIGALSSNEGWPQISISHYNNEFYTPEEGIAVAEWVKAFPEYERGEEISIAGLDTVHYVQVKTPQAWASDYYYFIKDNQLYNITITHVNDKEDWKLYNKILDSFTFNEVIKLEE